MRKFLKNQKGVNLVTLSVTIIIIMAILGIVLYNVRSNLGIQRLQSMQSDIENLRGKVSNYYLQYGALPILKKQIINDSVLNDNIKTVENTNVDKGNYYVIDLSALENLTLTYGEDYEKIKNESESNIADLKDNENNTLTDLYIINSVSHNIFYVHGIKYDGTMYYKQYQDAEDADIGISGINLTESETSNWSPLYATTTKYKDKNDNVAIIPAGFQVSRKSGEDTIENGLVVRDSNENEWVWIPVSSEDLALMYEEDEIGWTMLGTDVNTKYKTLSTMLGSRTLNRTNPGLTTDPYYREPDLLSQYDIDQTYRTQAGFEDLADMATKLKDDYKKMIDSVKMNEGFYVGRYELGGNLQQPLEQKNKTTIINQNWYNMYKACKSFSDENIEARMIWGCQWDQVCRFINNHGDKKDLNDSTAYGNYNDSASPANIPEAGSIQATGFSEKWKVNNIYDLAGNCDEWTQEPASTDCRTYRGGSYSSSGTSYSISGREKNYGDPGSTYNTRSSRPILYLK